MLATTGSEPPGIQILACGNPGDPSLQRFSRFLEGRESLSADPVHRHPARSRFPLGMMILAVSLSAAVYPKTGEEKNILDREFPLESSRKWGRFFVQPKFQFRDVGYDDNVRFDNQDPEGDMTATLAPSLEAWLRGGDRTGLRLFQEAGYVTFSQNSDLDHWDLRSEAKGVYLAGDYALSMEGFFRSWEDRPNSEVDERLPREEISLATGVETDGNGRLGGGLFFKRTGFDYSPGESGSQNVAERLNREERSYTLMGKLRILPKTTFTMEGTVERVNFDNPLESDTRVHSLLPGIRFDPSASLQGEIRLGVLSLEASDGPENDYETTVGSARLSTRFGRGGRLRGEFDRELVYSTLEEYLFFMNSIWLAAYEQFFSRRFSAEFEYGKGLNEYPDEAIRSGSGPIDQNRKDHLTRYQFWVRYRIYEELMFVGRIQHSRRDSNDDVFDLERNFYTIGVTYAF